MFQNTKIDLSDCISVLEDIRDGERNSLEGTELRSAKYMYELCKQYIDVYEELYEEE